MSKSTPHPCIAIFGGSFDPVHIGHVALAEGLVNLLKPDELRLVPTGWSQQKAPCQANPKQRIQMLSLAFAKLAKAIHVIIDEQEIERAKLNLPSYTIDTLAALRKQYGDDASLILLMGADQLHQFQHWKNWRDLFDLAHVVVATRPGFALNDVDPAVDPAFDPAAIDPFVAKEFKQRAGTIEQIRQLPHGYTYLWDKLAIDVASTQIRNDMAITRDISVIPSDVLNYIQQHRIYKNGY